MRCKDYFQVREFFECISLSSDSEQRSDKLRLSSYITSDQPFDLPFTYHVYRFNAFQCSLRRVKVFEALRRSHLLFYETMVLLNYIVQVLRAPESAVLRHNLLRL